VTFLGLLMGVDADFSIGGTTAILRAGGENNINSKFR